MSPAIPFRLPRQWVAGGCVGAAAAVFVVTPGVSWKLVVAAIALLVPLLLWLLDRPNRWLLSFFAAAWLLPPLPVRLGDSGPHVALFLVLAGLLIATVSIYRWHFRPDLITFVLIVLPLVFLGSSAVAAILWGPSIGAGSLARVILFSISVFAFHYTRSGPFDVSPARLRVFLKALFLFATVSAVLACLDFYFQLTPPAGFAAQFIWLDGGMFRRAQGVFYEASTLGNLCVCFLDMIAVCLLMPREQCPIPKALLLVAAIPLVSALVLSYSRASAVALLIGLIVLCCHQSRRLRLGRYFVVAALALVLPALFLVRAVPAFVAGYWSRIYNSFAYFGTSPNSILSGRMQSWQTLLTFVVQHPWHLLLGTGFKTLPYTDLADTPVIADNTYLSILIETGLAGFLLLILLNILILRHSYRASRSVGSNQRFFGTWMLCFWAGECVQMFSGDLLTYWRLLPAYFCIFALAVRVES